MRRKNFIRIIFGRPANKMIDVPQFSATQAIVIAPKGNEKNVKISPK